jgi:hypothetical protein
MAQWRLLENTVINHWFPYKAGCHDQLSNISSSTMTLLHGVSHYEIQGVQFNTSPTITFYDTKMKSEACPHPWHSSQGHPGCQTAAHASYANAVQVRTWCIHKQNVCSFSNITSHRNRLLLTVKRLATRILTSKLPNKAIIHRLETKFRDTGNVCDRKHVRRRYRWDAPQRWKKKVAQKPVRRCASRGSCWTTSCFPSKRGSTWVITQRS